MSEFDFSLWGPGVDQGLKDRFVEDATWPVTEATLAALIDLGMSDALISDYFIVQPEEVRALRREFGF